MLQALPLWLHVVAATTWVGSQIMMFAVVVPSLRSLPDQRARVHVLEALSPRFAWLGFGALATLVLTGAENVFRYAPDDMLEVRYGYIFSAKMVLLTVVFLLTLVHTLAVGPALLRAQARAADGAPEPALSVLRRRSVVFSSLTLVLSLAVLFCAVLLRSAFAHRLV